MVEGGDHVGVAALHHECAFVRARSLATSSPDP